MNYPRIIAHRCGGSLAPENSLVGLKYAYGIGCRGVEFDVMLTADSVPVLMHDEILDRTTDSCGLVAEHTLCDLRRVSVGGEPIPTLAEALILCRRLGLWTNVEIKPNRIGSRTTALAVAEVLDEFWDGRGVVSSFSMDVLMVLQANAGHWPRALLVDSFSGDWLLQAQELGVVAVHGAADCFAERLVGIGSLVLAAYTVDDRLEAHRLFGIGVDSIFSDRPDRWPAEEM